MKSVTAQIRTQAKMTNKTRARHTALQRGDYSVFSFLDTQFRKLLGGMIRADRNIPHTLIFPS